MRTKTNGRGMVGQDQNAEVLARGLQVFVYGLKDLFVDQLAVDGHEIKITSNISILPSTYTLGVTGEYERIIKYSKYYIDSPEVL